MNRSKAALTQVLIVAGLVAVLFVSMAQEQGFVRAGALLLAFAGVIAQGLALAAVVGALSRRERPGAGSVLLLSACMLVELGLMYTPWSKPVWRAAAFSLVIAGGIVLARWCAGKSDRSRS